MVTSRMIAAILFIIAGFPISANSAAPDELAANVIQTIAKYEGMDNANVSIVMKLIGYEPPTADFNQFPIIRKLELGYKAAESEAPGGGNRFLSAVAQRLYVAYKSIQNDKSIEYFVSQNKVGDERIAFNYNTQKYIAALTPEAHEVIARIARYAGGSRIGGTYGILSRNFQLGPDVAYSVLAEARTNREALANGFGRMPLPIRNERLLSVIEAIEGAYPGSQMEAAFIAFKESLNRNPVIPGRRPADNVECYCGGRYIGSLPPSMCIDDTPCYE